MYKNQTNNQIDKKQINDLISICKKQYDMIQSLMGDCPSASFENYTEPAQDVIATKGDSAMAYKRIRVCVGFNDDGSQVLKQVGANSETELADRIVQTMLQSERRSEFVNVVSHDTDSIPIKAIPTLKEYASVWLTTYKEGKLKPTTLHGYKVMLNAHLYPAWGDTPINKIDARAIQAFWDERKELSRKYLRDLKNFLSQILESAKLDKIIADNPCRDSRLKNPSDKVKEREPVSESKLKEIVSALHLLDDDIRAQKYLALVIFTGARKGEILGLRYEDVDYTANVIHIRRNVTHTSNQPIIGTPKTQAGYRDVPIMDGLKEFIKSGDPSLYIVGDSDTPMTQSAHARMMQRIKRKIDLDGATSHCFRHSMGTILADTGANVKTIQAIIGQRDFRTTADRYVHPSKEREMEAAARVNDRICSVNA